MNRFQHILFDLDGTLSESAEGITKSVQYALRSVGIEEPDLHELETFVGPPLNVEFQRRYHFDDATCEAVIRKYRERYSEVGIFECRLYDGIPETLRDLREQGATLAVASSKPEIFVHRIMEHFDVAQYFSVMRGSRMEDEMKNKAGSDNKERVVRAALADLGATATKGSTAMVGDRSFDILGALHNGVTPVGVTFGYGSRQELEEAGAEPSLIAESVEELRRILMA